MHSTSQSSLLCLKVTNEVILTPRTRYCMQSLFLYRIEQGTHHIYTKCCLYIYGIIQSFLTFHLHKRLKNKIFMEAVFLNQQFFHQNESCSSKSGLVKIKISLDKLVKTNLGCAPYARSWVFFQNTAFLLLYFSACKNFFENTQTVLLISQQPNIAQRPFCIQNERQDILIHLI